MLMTWAMVYYMAFLASIQYDQMGRLNRLLNNHLNILFRHIYKLLGEEMGENGAGDLYAAARWSLPPLS